MKGFLTFLVAVILAAAPIFVSIEFKQNCSGFIKQAADANSIELCQKSLNKAIAYAEKHNLTSGYTSVLYKTEDENIGFWYENLKACQAELASIEEDASTLEKSNLLMKVRESLLDDGKDGTEITLPKGIQYYPANFMFGLLRIVSWLLIIIGLALIR